MNQPWDFGLSENAAAMSRGSSPYGITESGITYLKNSADSFVDAQNLERQWLREDMIRREGYEREDSAYARLFDELKGLGVNPALLLSSVDSHIGSANSAATATFKNSNYAANEKTQAANSAKMVGAILAALAAIVVAAI